MAFLQLVGLSFEVKRIIKVSIVDDRRSTTDDQLTADVTRVSFFVSHAGRCGEIKTPQTRSASGDHVLSDTISVEKTFTDVTNGWVRLRRMLIKNVSSFILCYLCASLGWDGE